MRETFRGFRWASIIAPTIVAFIYLIGYWINGAEESTEALLNELNLELSWFTFFLLNFFAIYIVILFFRLLWAAHNLIEYGFYSLNKLKERE